MREKTLQLIHKHNNTLFGENRVHKKGSFGIAEQNNNSRAQRQFVRFREISKFATENEPFNTNMTNMNTVFCWVGETVCTNRRNPNFAHVI